MSETLGNPGITSQNLYVFLCQFAEHMAEKQQPMSQTKMGQALTGDPNLMFGLRNGREVRRATIERILRFVESRAPGFTAKFVEGTT